MAKFFINTLMFSYLTVMSGCMFLGDRKVHVSGTVTDESGHPIEGAIVRFYGDVGHFTDKKGAFLFGGHLPGGRLPLRVTKPGYKPYEGSNKFNFYDVTIILAGISSSSESKANWKVLKENELINYQYANDTRVP